MKSVNRSLIIAASVAFCLVAAASSLPFGNDRACGPQGGACPGGMAGFGFMGHFLKNASENDSAPMVMTIRRAGTGFAMNDGGYHVIDLQAQSTFNPDKTSIRSLIDDNKTIGQIKSDIESEMNAQMASGSHNGSLVIGESLYWLKNAQWTPASGDNATLEADIAGPVNITGRLNRTEFQASVESAQIAGHISLDVATHDTKDVVGTGNLSIDRGDYSGTYNVLINMGSGKGMGVRENFFVRKINGNLPGMNLGMDWQGHDGRDGKGCDGRPADSGRFGDGPKGAGKQ